jgi:hypothetical protein
MAVTPKLAIMTPASGVKIKNHEYSQAVGREDLFDRQKAREETHTHRPQPGA